MLTGQRIVCVSSIDWDFIWQGPQEVMTRLARGGNDVAYIDNLGSRSPALRDAGRIVRRARNWLRGPRTEGAPTRGVRVFSPVVLPFPYAAPARWINTPLLRRQLAGMFGGLRPTVAWIYLPTPAALDLVAVLRPGLVVFHMIDDMKQASPEAHRMASSERELIERADIVFATSAALERHALRFRQAVHRAPSGVDIDLFAPRPEIRLPDDLAAIPAPRVVYVGGLHRWVDLDLLALVATKARSLSFCLVGPVQESEAYRLRSLTNVHVLGPRAHEDLPGYIAGSGAAMIPYRRALYTDSVYPVKLNEYLAMGKPVIATALPEIVDYERRWPGTVSIADDPARFADLLVQAVADRDEGAVERRIAAARANSWTARLEEMSGLVTDALRGERSS